MMAQNSTAAQRWNSRRRQAAEQAKLTIDLPADRALQDSALLDQVIALAFERLGQIVVELRIREAAANAHGVA
jgi:hypothetical protein